MINKKPTHAYAALKNILVIPLAAILFLMFSFKTVSNPPKSSYQQPLFSSNSQTEIYKFINMNIVYLRKQNSSDIGRIYVVVKVNKGGIIKDCKAFTETKKSKFP